MLKSCPCTHEHSRSSIDNVPPLCEVPTVWRSWPTWSRLLDRLHDLRDRRPRLGTLVRHRSRLAAVPACVQGGVGEVGKQSAEVGGEPGRHGLSLRQRADRCGAERATLAFILMNETMASPDRVFRGRALLSLSQGVQLWSPSSARRAPSVTQSVLVVASTAARSTTGAVSAPSPATHHRSNPACGHGRNDIPIRAWTADI